MTLPKIDQLITLVNIIVMVLLIACIVIQNRSAGGLSTVFGGSGGVIQARRGSEKWIFFFTIVLAILFVGLSITSIILKVK